MPGFLGPLQSVARGTKECCSTLTPMSNTSFVREGVERVCHDRRDLVEARRRQLNFAFAPRVPALSLERKRLSGRMPRPLDIGTRAVQKVQRACGSAGAQQTTAIRTYGFC